MKRLTVFAIITMFVAVCFGQYRAGTLPRQPRRSPRVSSRKVIQLNEPTLQGVMSLEETLANRRSVRRFDGKALKQSQISQLAWAGQGITEPEAGLRTAPSAGATYPIELYFVTEDGLFVYQPQQHSMEQITEQDIRNDLAATISTPEVVANAGCNIVIAGSSRKVATQFRDKAKTFMLLEAGHIAQNIHLQAVSLGLGSVAIGNFDSRNLDRVCRLQRNLEPIYIICVGYQAPEETPSISTEQTIAGIRRAVLIVASNNFREEELFETKRALEAAGVQTAIASSRVGIVRGMLGNTAEARIPLNQLRVSDYNAIVFIGGTGAFEYFDNPVALNIAREALNRRKILAAICVAPTILSNAGVLTGVRATSFISERERLVQGGAIYTGAPVERDGLIITSSGPLAAGQFGMAIADAIAGR